MISQNEIRSCILGLWNIWCSILYITSPQSLQWHAYMSSLIITHGTKKKLYSSENVVCEWENGKVVQTLLSKREYTLFYQNNWMGAKWKLMSSTIVPTEKWWFMIKRLLCVLLRCAVLSVVLVTVFPCC